MSLYYACDGCATMRQGSPIPGIYAEVSDCLPTGWAMCVADRKTRLLCQQCYEGHDHG